MRSLRSSHKVMVVSVLMLGFLSTPIAMAGGTDPYGNEDPNKKILKSGLLGAGTGAIASSASGGDAGKGALIGAGTNVVGGALLDMLTTPSQPAQPQYAQQGYAQQPVYQQPVQYAQQPVYDNRQPVYYQQPVYQQPVEDPNKKILKSGLLGAGTGAIAASASGGKAGTGALIGAGTNVIGGALLDTLTAPSTPQYAQPQPVYYQQQPQYYQQQGAYPQQGYQQAAPKKKIIRKYDSEGNVVSEEEVYE